MGQITGHSITGLKLFSRMEKGGASGGVCESVGRGLGVCPVFMFTQLFCASYVRCTVVADRFAAACFNVLCVFPSKSLSIGYNIAFASISALATMYCSCSQSATRGTAFTVSRPCYCYC
jgi:hypothetical protein